ncbi:MAG: glycosyltransferase [Anaerolineales bacterium]|nr:glycosyltransferase [Anaerolineales bacterium]
MVTPDSHYIDRRILQEAETLITQGYEVILLADWQEGLATHERIGKVKLERLSSPRSHLFFREKAILYAQKKLPALTRITRLALYLSQKSRGFRLHEQAMLNRIVYFDPDIIHIHDLPYLKVGVEAKKRLQVPLIYDAHELYPEISTLTAKQKRDLSRIEARSIAQCDRVITVNPLIAEEMARRYHIPQPEVILNAVVVPAGFKPTSKEDRFRQQFQIPADHQILLFQGWLSLDRGLAELVRAMAHLPSSLHLVLMGYGEEAKAVLAKIALEEKINDRVHFKEAVSQAELLFWTASADAGIIPYQPVDLNHYFCSPNKLFEFIQAGLPIIANDLPFLRQVVAGEGFGVVMPLTDVNSFAQAIQSMFAPEAGGPGRFKKNLLEKAAKYSWQVEETKLLDLYATLPSHNLARGVMA